MTESDRHIANRVVLAGLVGFLTGSAVLFDALVLQQIQSIDPYLALKGFGLLVGMAVFLIDQAYVRNKMNPKIPQSPPS